MNYEIDEGRREASVLQAAGALLVHKELSTSPDTSSLFAVCDHDNTKINTPASCPAEILHRRTKGQQQFW